MEKIIKIDGREVGFKASALTPRLYRHRIGRDMIQDLTRLRKAFEKAGKLTENASEEEQREAQLSNLDLEIFENAAFVMAKQFDNTIPQTPEEWLDGFATFSIYQILPTILELWDLNNMTTSTAKKNKTNNSKGNRSNFYASMCSAESF